MITVPSPFRSISLTWSANVHSRERIYSKKTSVLSSTAVRICRNQEISSSIKQASNLQCSWTFSATFNVCHPEVFNTYIKYTMMCQSHTTNLYYVFIVLGQHVSILIEPSSGPSKKTDPYLAMLKCAVGSQMLTFLIKLCIKCMCHCFLNVQSRYLFLKL